MNIAIPHLRPWILPEDIEAVNNVLSQKSVCHWHYAEKLAESLREYSGYKYCLLYATGTLALRAALLSLRLPIGSAIGIPTFTCDGVLHAVVNAGYEPHIIDCDNYGLMSADIAQKAYQDGYLSACVSVHQFGLINRSLEQLTRLMPVIEDCSHVPPRACLNGSWGIIGSLEGTKLLGAGEGGYLLCNDIPDLAHSIGSANTLLGGKLSDVIAVLALCQLERLDENLRCRESIAYRFMAALGDVQPIDDERAAWFRFLLRMNSFGSVEKLIEKALNCGITLRRPIMPHPLHHYVRAFYDKCPEGEKLWKNLVSIPLYPDLMESELEHIIKFLRDTVVEI